VSKSQNTSSNKITENILLSASDDGNIGIFDLVSGQLITVIQNAHTNSSAVLSVVWSPDEIHFASTSMDGKVKIWEYNTQTPNILTHASVMTWNTHTQSNSQYVAVWHAAYTSDGKILVTVDDAGGIRIFQTVTTTSAR